MNLKEIHEAQFYHELNELIRDHHAADTEIFKAMLPGTEEEINKQWKKGIKEIEERVKNDPDPKEFINSLPAGFYRYIGRDAERGNQ